MTTLNYNANARNVIKTSLGSFFSRFHSGESFLDGFIDSTLNVYEQSEFDIERAKSFVSRQDAQPFKRKLWQRVAIFVDQYEEENDSYKFGDSVEFGDITFNQQKTTNTEWRIGIPENTYSCSLICNKVFEPTVILSQGFNFIVSKGEIRFNVDIRTLDFPRTNIRVNGEEKEVIYLWFYNSLVDDKAFYDTYGFLTPIPYQRNLTRYKDAVNAYFQALSVNSTSTAVRIAIANVLGLDYVRSKQETVLNIFDLNDATCIKTDKNAYLYKSGQTISVSEGDVVYEGDILISDIKFSEGPKPVIFDEIAQIVIPQNYISIEDFNTSLTFQNTAETISIVDGKPVFPIGSYGVPSSIASDPFWSEVHSTDALENYLKLDKNLPYSSGNSVDEVNPLQLLSDTIFTECAILYLGPGLVDSISYSQLRHLSLFMPLGSSLGVAVSNALLDTNSFIDANEDFFILKDETSSTTFILGQF